MLFSSDESDVTTRVENAVGTGSGPCTSSTSAVCVFWTICRLSFSRTVSGATVSSPATGAATVNCTSFGTAIGLGRCWRSVINGDGVVADVGGDNFTNFGIFASVLGGDNLRTNRVFAGLSATAPLAADTTTGADDMATALRHFSTVSHSVRCVVSMGDATNRQSAAVTS